MIWNERTVEKWLREAVETIYALHMGRIGPQPLKAWWPEVIRSHKEAYGYHKPKIFPAAPERVLIDRLPQVESWVNKWLSEDERRVVWERAAGLSWRKVAAKCKRRGVMISHEKARIVYRQAIWTLVRGLNGKEAAKRVAA